MTAAHFQVISFGCKVNQVEGEALAARLRGFGLVESPPGAPADLVIVNTCAVTAEAARQCRQRVRRAVREGAAVVVTGCAAHPAADAAMAAIAGVLLVDPDKDRAAEGIACLSASRLIKKRVQDPFSDGLVGRSKSSQAKGEKGHGASANGVCGRVKKGPGPFLSSDEIGLVAGSPAPQRKGPGPFSGGPFSGDLEAGVSARARALLKVQDGCPAACAYCIVPKVRPGLWSMPPGEASRRVGELVAAGFHEIVLCGIHLGLYGAGLEPRSALADLVGRLSAAQGDFRIRLSSIEPMEATDALLERMAAEPQRLCPHLHLPLQSGDDEVLRRMGRPYTAAEFLGVIGRVRKMLPLAAITTDVMVGFPGETEGAFERTLAACRAAGFSRIHVFPFSRRPGTAAAGMSPQAPREVIRARRARAAALGDELAAAYRRGLVGREARVVVEKVSADGSAEGLCERYVRVRIRSPRVPSGAGCFARRQLISVRIAGAEGDCLIGELLGGENSAPVAGNSLHAGRPRVS